MLWCNQSLVNSTFCANTHPDLLFAIHHCQNFLTNPHFLDKKSVKHIGQCLLLMQHQGLNLNPQANHTLNPYVDANFTGWWHQAYSNLYDSTLSCTCCVLVYYGCPISWTSKLQLEIALNTTKLSIKLLACVCMTSSPCELWSKNSLLTALLLTWTYLETTSSLVNSNQSLWR